MPSTFLNWTSRAAIAGRIAECHRPQTGMGSRYLAITTCRSARPRPGPKPRSGFGKFSGIRLMREWPRPEIRAVVICCAA